MNTTQHYTTLVKSSARLAGHKPSMWARSKPLISVAVVWLCAHRGCENALRGPQRKELGELGKLAVAIAIAIVAISRSSKPLDCGPTIRLSN